MTQMRKTVDLQSFDAVAANSKSTLWIRPSYCYHELLLELTNITTAQITDLKLYLDSVEIQSWTGTDLDKFNQYRDRAAAGTMLAVPLTRAGMLDRPSEYSTAINVGVPSDKGYVPAALRLELTLGAVTSPAIRPRAIVSDAVAGMPLNIQFVKRSNFDVNGSERILTQLVNIGSPQERYLDTMFFKTANLTELEVTRDQRETFKRTKAVNDRQNADGVRVPQAGYFAMDYLENGYGTPFDVLEIYSAREVKFTARVSAAETIGVYEVCIGSLN